MLGGFVAVLPAWLKPPAAEWQDAAASEIGWFERYRPDPPCGARLRDVHRVPDDGYVCLVRCDHRSAHHYTVEILPSRVSEGLVWNRERWVPWLPQDHVPIA